MSSFWIRHRTAPLFNSLQDSLPCSGRSLGRCFLLSLVTPQKHTKTLNTIKNFALLLFLEPVLLQSRQGSQARIHAVSLAAALFVVQIRAACRAQSAAIAAANCLHRHR